MISPANELLGADSADALLTYTLTGPCLRMRQTFSTAHCTDSDLPVALIYV